MSTLKTRLVGLAASLALLLLVAGIPALLVAIAVVPQVNDFSVDRLTSPDDGTMAVSVIGVVAWIAWLVLATSVLVELIARIRGIRAPRLPGLTIPQMTAGRLIAFAALLFVAVPAGWQLLGANIQTDGPALRPPKESFTIDGVTVSVELDRGITTRNGQVKAILVATSDTPKEISLDVRALRDNGYGEERVQNPPTVVEKRRVKVKAGPNGGAPVEVAFNLGNTHKGSVEWFDVDVMSSKVCTVWNRRPGDVGLYFRIGIV